MKTNNKIEVIKTMEKAFRDYDFLNTDTFINCNGINRKFKNKEIFKGFEIVILLNNQGFTVDVYKKDELIFIDYLGFEEINLYFQNGLSLSILVEIAIDLIERDLRIKRSKNYVK